MNKIVFIFDRFFFISICNCTFLGIPTNGGGGGGQNNMQQGQNYNNQGGGYQNNMPQGQNYNNQGEGGGGYQNNMPQGQNYNNQGEGGGYQNNMPQGQDPSNQQGQGVPSQRSAELNKNSGSSGAVWWWVGLSVFACLIVVFSVGYWNYQRRAYKSENKRSLTTTTTTSVSRNSSTK